MEKGSNVRDLEKKVQIWMDGQWNYIRMRENTQVGKKSKRGPICLNDKLLCWMASFVLEFKKRPRFVFLLEWENER